MVCSQLAHKPSGSSPYSSRLASVTCFCCSAVYSAESDNEVQYIPWSLDLKREDAMAEDSFMQVGGGFMERHKLRSDF